MADKYKIAESWMGVWVRSGPGTKYSKKSVIYGKDNREYIVTERQNSYWLKIPELNGWCCDRDANGMIVMKMTQKGVAVEGDNDKSSTKGEVDVQEEQKKAEEEAKAKESEQDEESYAYVPDENYQIVSLSQSDTSDFTTSLESNFSISTIRGIFGMPYQFMANSDPRVTDAPDGIGRKYAKEIVSHMPLLLITPGKPVFMAKYTREDQGKILERFIQAASGQEDGIRDVILSDKGFGKYYSLEYAYNDYIQYVNPMCRIAARLMNLQDVEVDGMKLDSYEWSEHTNANFSKLFSVYRGCTAWYCESENNVSDSFSNGTTESMMSSKINSLSEYGRELNFILGTVKSSTGVALDRFTSAENLASNMENVENFINGALGDNSLSSIFKSITGAAQTVASGGKLVFPEIWSESSFSRSYNVNLKLVSPDGDDLSIYLNIIVPMLHLLGLVLPRQADDTTSGFAYGYISPFLVRGFYKGFFNVDMGIITDLSFSKGKDSAWTSSGIPTTVDVSFTIKDLYNDMYMTDTSKMKNNMMKNIILMDYIANMCGININEVDVFRGIELFFTQNIENRIKDSWRVKLWGSLDQWVTNKWQNIFGKF